MENLSALEVIGGMALLAVPLGAWAYGYFKWILPQQIEEDRTTNPVRNNDFRISYDKGFIIRTYKNNK